MVNLNCGVAMDTADKLTEKELDMLLGSRRMNGLDYQGRHPEAAHAASEVPDVEPEDQSQGVTWEDFRGMVPWVLLVVFILGLLVAWMR